MRGRRSVPAPQHSPEATIPDETGRPEDAAVLVSGLRHRYGTAPALKLESWQVARGTRCLVLGPSGSGKTTLLHILAGLTTASEGSVTVDGVEVSALSATERDGFRARHIGFVPQRLHLIGAITLADNLRLARRLAGLPADDTRIGALLARLGVASLADRRPDALSQGQAQRAAVARALVNEPALLLADEPTAALDEDNAETAIALLEEAAEASGATLIVASHDRRIAGRFAQTLPLQVEAAAP